jgi:hypothetical protein
MKPLVDMVKVTFTQYEVAQITQLVVNDYKQSNGLLISPSDFSAFVRDQYHSQYSVVAREIAGDKDHDMARDIWGIQFQMITNYDVTNVAITSAGPDQAIHTKDDIKVDFNIKRRGPSNTFSHNSYGNNAPGTPTAATKQYGVDEKEYDEYGYDYDGFDREGFDRDGYDRHGFHRDEKKMYDEGY